MKIKIGSDVRYCSCCNSPLSFGGKNGTDPFCRNCGGSVSREDRTTGRAVVIDSWSGSVNDERRHHAKGSPHRRLAH